MYTVNYIYDKLIEYLTQSQYLELLSTYEVKADKVTKNAGTTQIFASKQHQEFIVKVENM